ncbi:hypothetical protein ES702_00667 [subsurface metagenome]
MKKRKGKKKFVWQPKNKLIYSLMVSPPGVIMINWIFQGILGMDTSERWFKIGLDIVLTLVLIPFLLFFFRFWSSVFLALFFAHTTNWLFNGHLFVIGRFIGFTYNSPKGILEYMKLIEGRVKYTGCLQGVVIFGKVTRGGGISNTSDVDIRFVRKKGFWNGLAANFWGINERTRALFARFPLDLYVYDNVKSLDRLRKDEKPIIVYDPNRALREKYKERGYTMLRDVMAKKWDEEDQKSV